MLGPGMKLILFVGLVAHGAVALDPECLLPGECLLSTLLADETALRYATIDNCLNNWMMRYAFCQ